MWRDIAADLSMDQVHKANTEASKQYLFDI